MFRNVNLCFPLQISNIPWEINQPDNRKGNEDCVTSFILNGQVVMKDYNCNDHDNYICETFPGKD